MRLVDHLTRPEFEGPRHIPLVDFMRQDRLDAPSLQAAIGRAAAPPKIPLRVSKGAK